jgi:two-component system copper resistance phosphate regulon response regulator CusR
MRVLLIEDEPKVAEAVREGLEAEGLVVMRERNGDDGLARACRDTFDLIILDLGLPGRSGLDVLAELRARGFTTRVLIITARDAIADRVAGLDRGADDYLVKPFAFAELLARVRALVRRGNAEPLRLSVADLAIDLLVRSVQRGGQRIDLTVKEFELLEYLVRHQGEVVSRESLARDVWKETGRSTPLDNVIDVHVARVRKKVEPDPWPRLIHTVRGVGVVVSEDAP